MTLVSSCLCFDWLLLSRKTAGECLQLASAAEERSMGPLVEQAKRSAAFFFLSFFFFHSETIVVSSLILSILSMSVLSLLLYYLSYILVKQT